MKLAEALQLRTDLQKRINQLSSRLCNNATVQEGEKPAEDPAALMEEYEDCVAQLEGLIARINRTNSETRTESGTLTELLARRDCLKLRLQTYHDFLASASSLTRRATRSEIRILSTIPVPEYQKRRMCFPAGCGRWTTPSSPPTGPPSFCKNLFHSFGCIIVQKNGKRGLSTRKKPLFMIGIKQLSVDFTHQETLFGTRLRAPFRPMILCQ